MDFEASSSCTCSLCCGFYKKQQKQGKGKEINWKLMRKRRIRINADDLRNDYNDGIIIHYYNDQNQDYNPPLELSPPSTAKLMKCANTNSNGSTFPKLSNPFPIPVTVANLLVIFLLFLLASPRVEAYPFNDCDWSGSGTPDNVVQAVYLRCQQGHIIWDRPKGGLRVNISPPKYFTALGQRDKPFRLCLEARLGSNFKVFLEQSYPSEGPEERRKLLLFITPDKQSSTCYRIDSPTATLYVESQSQQDDTIETPATISTNNGMTSSSQQQKDAYQVKISYEIEELKEQARFSDDECRPCSDQEVLHLYCVADVVARGEILSVRPSSKKTGLDNLHIKSNLLIHQNHAVFQPLKPGGKHLQKFLSQDATIFDQDSPAKMTKSVKSKYFGGIVSHPTKCAAQSGPGEFLWLIKLSFGRPKIGCVLYWDRWVQIAKEAAKSGISSCSLVYQ